MYYFVRVGSYYINYFWWSFFGVIRSTFLEQN